MVFTRRQAWCHGSRRGFTVSCSLAKTIRVVPLASGMRLCSFHPFTAAKPKRRNTIMPNEATLAEIETAELILAVDDGRVVTDTSKLPAYLRTLGVTRLPDLRTKDAARSSLRAVAPEHKSTSAPRWKRSTRCCTTVTTSSRDCPAKPSRQRPPAVSLRLRPQASALHSTGRFTGLKLLRVAGTWVFPSFETEREGANRKAANCFALLAVICGNPPRAYSCP